MNDKDSVVVPSEQQAQFDAEQLMDVAGTLSRCGYGEDAAEVREIAKRLAAAPSTSVREEVDPDLLKRLSDRLAMATPGPWTVQDGCSWRRIGTRFHDGNVLCPTNHPRDNHPDLSAADGKLYANLMLIVEVVNALPTLLAALKPSTDKGGVE